MRKPMIVSYTLSIDTRVVPLIGGAVMLSRGDFVAPSVALRLSVAEQRELISILSALLATDQH